VYRIILLLCLAGIAVPPAADVLGTHPPNSSPAVFDGMNVPAVARLTPWDITAGETTEANLRILLFDTATRESVPNVTYRIDIYRNDGLLARNTFYDADGTLDVEVRPDPACHSQKLWQCTRYLGAAHPVSGGLHAAGGERPVIWGPVFDRAGLYDIRVTIEGTHDPANLLAEPPSFEARVAVSQEYDFLIRAEQARVPVVVKTYYDEITSFGYSDVDDAIRMEMPFDWSPGHVSQVKAVRQEVRIPDSFEPYADATDLRGYVNGVELGGRVLLLDPYSYNDTNVIHFLVTGDELERINDLLGPSNHDAGRMAFELVPQGEAVKNSMEFNLVNPDTGDPVGSAVNISWDSRHGAGDEIPFHFAFFDESGDLLRDVKYGYHVIDMNDGNNILMSAGDDPSNLGIDATEGIDVQKILIPTQGTYRIDVRLLGRGLDFDPTYAGAVSAIIEVGPSSGIDTPPAQQPDEISIPPWVKSNAGLWSGGLIDDATFVGGIEYMIRERIITVPATDSDSGARAEIPSWVRGNAKLWSDGRIDDQAFVHGLQWLVANGVIAAGSLAPEHLLPETPSDEISPHGCEMQAMSPEHDLLVQQPLPVWHVRGEKMQVMSPEHDLGCVDAFTARFLENSGWHVLDEYPEDFASSSWFENAGNLADFKRWQQDPHTEDGLEIELRMPEVPLVGQSADIILDVVSPHTASPVNASFRIWLIGDVKVVSSDPPMKNVTGDLSIGKDFYTPRTTMLPGETRQFSVTVVPLSETPLQVWADGYQDWHSITQSSARIRVSIGDRQSSYQLGGDLHDRDPDTWYVWTQIPHPQCWMPPWDRNGQHVQDYYADRGIEVHDTEWLPHHYGAMCEACSCLDGYVMFLTPERDRADVLGIDFGVEHPP